ncbi:FAD-dependent oxidoreductase [Nocardia transvalensis]|uniref:FAD-dependent oxidoreductase n=1 Tax=Nocardia transvalensis TaxID=37333 RepID=UPI00189325C6|nr:FAD-dependent oxidoreductase [Nocardia transvalensis]MBF6327913.1 FAD-dependent oxidoreductase [Nocardia transvalensis]
MTDGSSVSDVLVLGAGVIGLTTAIALAESGRSVLVWTESDPAETTSAVAGAIWGRGSGALGPVEKVGAWAAHTRTELLAHAEDPDTGVRVVTGLEATRASEWTAETHLGSVRRCAAADLPPGYRDGRWLTAPIVDMPRYLAYLTRRCAAAGVRFERRRVAALAETTAVAPIVVNCTGSAARFLVPDPDLSPVRGQHVVVANPGIDGFFLEQHTESTWTAFFPHGDRVVLGGTAEPGVWDRRPDPTTATAIITRCAHIDPRLAEAPVLAHLVGLRPQRPSVRVELDHINNHTIVHNYGHGGLGVTLSWGCAREVTTLLDSRT